VETIYISFICGEPAQAFDESRLSDTLKLIETQQKPYNILLEIKKNNQYTAEGVFLYEPEV